MNIIPLFKAAYYGIKRGRQYQILLIFAPLMLASSTLFTFFTREEEMKLIKDIGFMAINLFGLIFILFGLSRHIPREIEDKTIYTLLANPISRTCVLAADLFAYLYAAFISFLIMSAIFYGILYLKEGFFGMPAAKGIILIYLKVAAFSTVVLFFSVIFTPLINIALSLFLYIGGHLTNYISALADRTGFLGWCFFKAIYTLLPNYENYNCSDALALGLDVSWRYIGAVVIYTLLYGTAVFLLAALLFRRKEI